MHAIYVGGFGRHTLPVATHGPTLRKDRTRVPADIDGTSLPWPDFPRPRSLQVDVSRRKLEKGKYRDRRTICSIFRFPSIFPPRIPQLENDRMYRALLTIAVGALAVVGKAEQHAASEPDSMATMLAGRQVGVSSVTYVPSPTQSGIVASCTKYVAVSYTHLTLPTKRIV